MKRKLTHSLTNQKTAVKPWVTFSQLPLSVIIQITYIPSQVTTEEGKALATQLGCPFFETSAALRHFVDDAFHALVREIRRLERQRQV